MTDKFSFQRIDQIWSFYHPAIIRQWMWTLIAVVALFLIAALARAIDSFGTFSLVNTMVCAPVYLGPLVFTYYNDRAMQIQLPATACEKASFYIFHSLIVMPVAVLTLWLSLNGLSALWGNGITIYDYFMDHLLDEFTSAGISIMSPQFIIQRLFMELLPVSVTLYTVLAARSHRVIKGICAAIGTLIAYGILSGIVGFVAALTNVQMFTGSSEEICSDNRTVEFVTKMMSDLMLTLTVFSAITVVFFIYLIYRKVKRMQD